MNVGFVAAAGVIAMGMVALAQPALAIPMTTAVQTVSVPTQITDFNASVSFAKFDTRLGNLLSVTYSIAGTVTGLIQVENVDPTAKTATSSLNATLSLQRPDGSTLTFTLPVANFSDRLTAFDGTEDYAGTSGVSHNDITASNSSGNVTSTSAADLALFSGVNQTITLNVFADGNSSIIASGNNNSRIRTLANSTATVFYTYDVPTTVPEPASMALLGVGLLGAGLIRRRYSQ